MYPSTRRRTSSSATSSALTAAKVSSQSAKSVKKVLSKPAWDATLSDLNQMKPTKEDLEKRKANLMSKNKDIVKFEKIKQEMLKTKTKNVGRLSDSQARLALIQQILYDDEQLKTLIDKSDSTLKLVKDLCNNNNNNVVDENCDTHSIASNNTNMKQAKINLTLAPNVTDLNESILPIDVAIANKTREQKSNAAAEVKINYPNSMANSNWSDLENLEKINKLKNELENYQKMIMLKLNNGSCSEKPPNQPQPQLKSIANQGVQDDQTQTQPQQQMQHNRLNSFSSTTIASLNDEVKKAIGELEAKLSEFEHSLGRAGGFDAKQPSSSSSSYPNTSQQLSTKPQSMASSASSSYTLTLIRMVSTLCDYLRDACAQMNYEKMKQVELNKQLDIHRKLIDGLTTEIMHVKEQNQKIINDYVNQNAKIEAELDQIKIYLRSTLSLSQPVAVHTNQQYQHHSKLPLSAFTLRPPSTIAAMRPSGDVVVDEDKFAERLSAMLSTDSTAAAATPTNAPFSMTTTSSLTNIYPTAAAKLPFYSSQPHLMARPATAQSDLFMMNTANTAAAATVQIGLSRPMSAMEVENRPATTNRNSLKSGPIENTQKRLSSMSQSQHSLISDTAASASSELKAKNDALEKLQRERQLVKEQLSRLNKERQAAAADLIDELTRNSVSSSSSSSVAADSNAAVGVELVAAATTKNLSTADIMKRLKLNCDLTPNLSPISPQNVFQDTRN